MCVHAQKLLSLKYCALVIVSAFSAFAFTALCCWLGDRKGILPVKTECWYAGMVIWLWGEVQICMWPSWDHCHSLSLAPVNPDWFYLPGFAFLVLADTGSPVQNPESCKMVVVVVVIVVVNSVVMLLQYRLFVVVKLSDCVYLSTCQ